MFNLSSFDLSLKDQDKAQKYLERFDHLEPILSGDVDLVLSTFTNAEYINEGYISPNYDEYMAYCFYYKRYKPNNNKILKPEINIYGNIFKNLDFISFNVLSLKLNPEYFFIVQNATGNYFSYLVKKSEFKNFISNFETSSLQLIPELQRVVDKVEDF